MIWILRNISMHLWLSTLIAIPSTFYLMSGIERLFPGTNPVIAGFAALSCIIVIVYFLMDIAAKKIISNLIKEGLAWERSGIINKAEKNYIKALRIYDTFLLLPFFAGKTMQKILGAIAKFELNTSVKNQHFKLITTVYLKMNQTDEEVAELWLRQLRQAAIVTSFDQAVLSLLSKKHYNNKVLSVLMIDIFLGLKRKDFTAKQLYHHVLKDPVLENTYAKKIENVIGRYKQTIADSLQQAMGRTDSLSDREQLSFLQPEKPKRKIKLKKTLLSIIQKPVSFAAILCARIGSVLKVFILSIPKLYKYIKEHEKVRFYLKACFLLIVSLWLLVLIINTLSHTFKSRIIGQEQFEMTMLPFTIQVAAYLQQKHADSYVNVLKKQGIDASFKKVDGGGKTWFVVLVSKFADKKSAAEYGEKLKKEKIIDDFFVNNK